MNKTIAYIIGCPDLLGFKRDENGSIRDPEWFNFVLYAEALIWMHYTKTFAKEQSLTEAYLYSTWIQINTKDKNSYRVTMVGPDAEKYSDLTKGLWVLETKVKKIWDCSIPREKKERDAWLPHIELYRKQLMTHKKYVDFVESETMKFMNAIRDYKESTIY